MGWTSCYMCNRCKWVLAATDRNGLRPLRYTITSDDLFFAGSESGMIKIPEEKIISKGN